MPSSPSPQVDDKRLCPACRELAPGRRGHTFLVPQRRDGGGGYFLCLECGALWLPTPSAEGRVWKLCRVEERDSTQE